MILFHFVVIFAGLYISFLIIACAISTLYDYCNSIDNRLKIKFDSFIKFYNVNPNAWTLHDNYVVYVAKSRCSSYQFSYYIVDKSFEFCFPFLDYIRYNMWKKQADELKQKKKNAQEYLSALKYIEADIKNFTEQNNNLLEDEIKKITERM